MVINTQVLVSDLVNLVKSLKSRSDGGWETYGGGLHDAAQDLEDLLEEYGVKPYADNPTEGIKF